MSKAEGKSNTGDVIEGKYRIEGLMGKGGMGEVYRVTHLTLDKIFALKIMIHEKDVTNPVNLIRFQREAKALAVLNHPNIVMIVDYGVTKQHAPYIVMEYIEGNTLREKLEQGPLSIPQTIQFAKQICSGLQAAHLQDIIHRDLKPENIMLQRLPGGELMAKVLDFGIAKSSKFNESSEESLTGDNVAGTMKYMAYEQIAGEQTDGRTDIFAVCSLIYEMLTCVVPSCMKVKVEPLHVLRQDVPFSLSAVVHKGLSRSPEHRQASMMELKRDLENIEHDEVVESIEKSRQPNSTGPLISPYKVDMANFKMSGSMDTNSGQRDTNENNRNNTAAGLLIDTDSSAIKKSRRSGLKYLFVGFAFLLLIGSFLAYQPLKKIFFSQSEAKDKENEITLPTLVDVKGGKFTMGMNKGDDYAQPEHEVQIKDFSVGKFLITNKQYYEFIKDAHYQTPNHWQGELPPADILEKPVIGVSWKDALAYCYWLSKKTGKTYSIPSEDQWEYLARNKARLGIEEILGEHLEWTNSPLTLYPGNKKPLATKQPNGSIMHVFRGKNEESSQGVNDPACFRFFQDANYSYNNLSFRITLNSDTP